MSIENFQFCPELFELKAEASQLLDKRDIKWMTDYQGIDIVHDLYGIEVVGIKDRDTAQSIRRLLGKLLSRWLDGNNDGCAEKLSRGNGRICYGRFYEDSDGWVAEVNRDPHPPCDEGWL